VIILIISIDSYPRGDSIFCSRGGYMTDHNEYYTVNKVSQLTDVTIKTLHYYKRSVY